MLNGTEVCDGTDVGGQTCVEGGELAALLQVVAFNLDAGAVLWSTPVIWSSTAERLLAVGEGVVIDALGVPSIEQSWPRAPTTHRHT